MLFAEAEEETVLRAAITVRNEGYGIPVLVGRDAQVRESLRRLGIDDPSGFEIHNSRISTEVPAMVDYLYARLQRQGYLLRDCHRLVNQDRNVFGALLLALGVADVMITGVTRHFHQTLSQVELVIDRSPSGAPFGIHVVVGRSHTIFIADTTVHERPDAQTLADIAENSAAVARRMGHEPRVAFISYSNFGNPPGTIVSNVREAVRLLDGRQVGFEYEGEMSPDTALDRDHRQRYPFSRLSGPANVLVMPGLHAANISAKLLNELGGGRVIGPLLVGLAKPVQIVPMLSSTSDLVTLAALAASGVVH